MKKIVIAIAAMTSIACIFSVDRWQMQIWQQEKDIELQAELNVLSGRLENEIVSRFHAVEMLSTYFTLHPDTGPEKFAVLAANLIRYNPPVRAFQFADKNTRVTYVYPPKSNEVVIREPMVLIRDPKRSPYVKKAIATRKATIQGPFALRQGGAGIVVRTPIFINEQFAGLAIGVYDLPILLNAVVNEESLSEFAIQLSDMEGTIFWGGIKPGLLLNKKTIEAGDTRWTLSMAWKEGKDCFPVWNKILIWVFGGMFSATLLFLTHYFWSKSGLLQEQVSLEEKKFKNIFNAAPIGVEIYDSDGRLYDVNPECANIFGVASAKTVKGFNLFEDPNLPEEIKEQIKKGEPVQFESVFDFDKVIENDLYPTNKRGKINIEVFITPWKMDADDTNQFVVHVVDITEKKVFEKERSRHTEMMLKHKRDIAMGRMAGKMAHDFNNVLAVIMGNVELARQECRDPDILAMLKVIYDYSNRGKNITGNLTVFARDQIARKEFYDLDGQVDEILDQMKGTLGSIEIRKESNLDQIRVYADREKVDYVLTSILENSVHALSRTQLPKIRIEIYENNNQQLCLSIEDNGCGIPEASLEEIFEPSFTLKGSADAIGAYDRSIKGSGYGLTNVKKIMELHGGEMEVQSEEHSGTRTVIKFLKVLPEGRKKDKIRSVESQPIVKKEILIVEDEPEIVTVQRQLLLKAGIAENVDTAPTGQEAITRFDSGKYDLVSLDFMLEGNLTGLDVYHHIRKKNKDVPILFVSGNMEFLESVNQLLHKDSRLYHLQKPYESRDYLAAVTGMMNKNE